ncbi:protein mmf2, mitochondrial precursor [Boeremia exigua]|uniref:protein mmf2, mitochondrial precursor n=1 Tax=Boeremia exigua TaxID=749465 RepID=UPI001E8EBCEE|nr:protein mmf2, mitochondrial precursor [Boeremia exigua]KAH6612749.1 protein mmf2, mitochondrial precursor [Boeremia exigua]
MAAQREAVTSPNAPPPPPFLSQAIRDGNLLFCSGQVAVDPATNALVPGTVQDRTRQVLRNLAAVLESGNSSLALVNKINIFLVEPADFAAMNEVYETFFPGTKPARTCVFVKALPLGTDVEIECVASVGGTARL